jgi:hypothetical protein
MFLDRVSQFYDFFFIKSFSWLSFVRLDIVNVDIGNTIFNILCCIVNFDFLCIDFLVCK